MNEPETLLVFCPQLWYDDIVGIKMWSKIDYGLSTLVRSGRGFPRKG